MTAGETETRAALTDTAARWLGNAYGEERRRRTLANGGIDRAAWVEMAELGWFGIAVPEGKDGLGLSLADLAALMQAVGSAALPEPVAAVAGVAAPLLAADAGEQSATDLLAAIVAGERIAVLAYAEPDGGFDRQPAGTRLHSAAGGWSLDGAKTAVEAGGHADTYLVTAITDDGPAVVMVERSMPGLTVSEYRSLDGRVLADLAFASVQLQPSARVQLADPAAAIDAALDRGAVLSMADAVGAMSVLFDDTLAYLKTRQQFGRTIGSFQALQHRAVDMSIALEEARAVVEVAADTEGDERERRLAVATAKVIGARSARRISREAVQMHGGIGITEELRVSHLFRRLVVAESLYGDDDFYLKRFERAKDEG